MRCVNSAAGECVRSEEVEVVVREVIREKVMEAVRELQAGRREEGETTLERWYAYCIAVFRRDVYFREFCSSSTDHEIFFAELNVNCHWSVVIYNLNSFFHKPHLQYQFAKYRPTKIWYMYPINHTFYHLYLVMYIYLLSLLAMLKRGKMLVPQIVGKITVQTLFKPHLLSPLLPPPLPPHTLPHPHPPHKAPVHYCHVHK